MQYTDCNLDISCYNEEKSNGRMSKMNVLIMAKYSPRKSGNFIASLLELGLQLRDRGDQVFYMFPQASASHCEWLPWLKENGFEVTLFDDSRDSSAIIHDLQVYCQQRNIQLIHSHFSFCLKELALNLHKFSGVKLLLHDHMDYSPDKNIPVQHVVQLLLSLLYRLQGIGVVSVMEKKSRGYLLSPKKRVWFVPNGLSPKRYVKRSLSREEMRQHMEIPASAQMILFLGWDMHRKGVDIAIRAVEELYRTNPDVLLVLPGFGKIPAQKQCEWIRERTGLDPLETPWLRFTQDYEDMFACHRAADAYLSASRKEAFSYGLLEAISQNVPIVVSDIEGTSWAMQYNKSLTYPVEDASACAQALSQALTQRHSASNMDTLLTRYNINTWCGSIMDIYDQMLG